MGEFQMSGVPIGLKMFEEVPLLGNDHISHLWKKKNHRDPAPFCLGMCDQFLEGIQNKTIRHYSDWCEPPNHIVATLCSDHLICSSVISGVYGVPINGRKSMGNWGYFTLLIGVITPCITGSRGSPCTTFKSFEVW